MLDARRLLVLREVMRHGTIARAAESLYLTPSAVSQQLSALESQVGIQLLERGPRSVRLSFAGEVLAEHAARIAAELESADRALEALRTLGAGRVRVGFLATAGIALAPGALDRLKNASAIDVILHELEPEEAIPALREGDLDFAIVSMYSGLPRPDVDGLTELTLLDEPLLIAAPRGSFQVTSRPAGLKRYANSDWIAWQPSEGFQALTDIACRKAGFEPRIRCRADNPTLIHRLVAAGFGLSIVPRSAALPDERIDYHAIDSGADLRRQLVGLTRSSDKSIALAATVQAFADEAATLAGHGASEDHL